MQVILPSIIQEGATDIPTPASDLSALSATIYYAVTGVMPSLDPRVQRAQVMNATLSSTFATILLRGIHPDVQERYHSPSELVKALGAGSHHTSEAGYRASKSRTARSTLIEQKIKRSTIAATHASHPVALSQPLPSTPQRQEENLPPFPQSLDALVAMVWTVGILLCATFFLLVAQ